MSEQSPIEGRRQGPFANLQAAHLPDLHALRPAHDPVSPGHLPAALHAAASGACACARTRATRRCAARVELVSRARAPGRHRDPQLPRRRARARRSCASIAKTVAQGHGARDRRRRRQRRRAPRGAARDRRASTCVVESERNSGFAANVNRGLRAERSPSATSSCSTPTSRRCRAGWSACSTRAYGHEGGAASSAASCSTPTGASSSAAPCATATSRSGSTTATASSRTAGARPTRRARRSP